MNIKQQLQASVAAESECSMVHDRFGVTLMGPRANVLRAMAALETATRHDPRPVPKPRCDICGHEFMLRYIAVQDGHHNGQKLCAHCYRKHAAPCDKSMTVELGSNGIPLVRLGQGDFTRDYTPSSPIAEAAAERIDASQAPAPGTDPSRTNPPGA